MKKQFSYTVQRVIESLPITEDIYAYKDETFVDGISTKKSEGIVKKQKLELVNNDQPLQPLSRYGLVMKGIREQFRTKPWSEVLNEIEKEKWDVKEPYTYILQHGIEHVELLQLNNPVDGHTYDFEGNRIPRCYHFDYIQGAMDDEHYNLEEVYELLKKRSDIVFPVGGIQPLPYYAQDRYKRRCLEFLWVPSDDDFAKLRHDGGEHVTKIQIKEEILGLPQPRFCD